MKLLSLFTNSRFLNRSKVQNVQEISLKLTTSRKKKLNKEDTIELLAFGGGESRAEEQLFRLQQYVRVTTIVLRLGQLLYHGLSRGYIT